MTNTNLQVGGMDVGVDHSQTAKQKQEQEHGDPQMAFVKKLHDDGLIGISFQRCVALRCRFAGYRCSDNVEKTCVWPGGIYSWPEKSYGLKWVVVHGLESICIAIRRRDLDLELAGPFYRGLSEVRVMYGLSTAIIYEVEDLADELRKSSGQFIEKPFGVVSVNHSHEESGHEASSAEYDDKKAIEFLNEKMKRSCSEYTFEETVQTTVSAFQHLCLEELKAEDIFVCVCYNIETAAYRLSIKEIEERLACHKQRLRGLDCHL